MDYEKGYKILFNTITDVMNELEQSPVKNFVVIKGIDTLKKAQLKTEKLYLEQSTDFC